MMGDAYRGGGEGYRGGGRDGSRNFSGPVPAPYNNGVPVECLICAEPCRAVCVFPCGHYTCYSCGLHIHALDKSPCPVCRTAATAMPIITRILSREEEQYTSEEMDNMRGHVTVDRFLNCVIDSPQLASEVAKLYEFTCPLECCWSNGFQDPFVAMSVLKDHLRYDHHLFYCEVCLQHRPAFLCEQVAYSDVAMLHHMEGQCQHDRSSFTGHPLCRFCKEANRFYDGEALLKHMQQQHYTCDVCNRGQFTFTFYATRQKLNQHFQMCHKICDHPDCASLDLMMRVFGNEIDLLVHKQRVHGVKAKTSFSPAMFGEATSSPTSTGPAGSAPATASNTNVIQITFDHVSRVEKAEMMPSKTNHPRGGRRGGPQDTVHAPEKSGVPAYYVGSGSLSVLMRYPNNDGASMHPPRPGGGGGASVRVGGGGAGGPFSHSAFGVVEDMREYNRKNKLPTDKGQLEGRLNDLLHRHLRAPTAYARFREYTQDFINSTLLTSEYYDVLAVHFFPDPSVFHEVFPLIVATVPNDAKKMALQEVYKMRMAPETQRIVRAREEDARKEAERQAAAARAAEMQGRNSSRNASNNNSNNTRGGGRQISVPASPFGSNAAKGDKGKGNAWLMRDSRSKLGGGNAAGTTQHRDPSAPSSASPAGGTANAWGRPLAVSSTPATAGPPLIGASSIPAHSSRGLVINEENFPSLPDNRIRRAPNAKTKNSRPNSWFSR